MPKIRFWMCLNCLLTLPIVADAAGTYYTGSAYQPTQYRYGQSGTYATSGYGNTMSTTANARYNTGYGTNYSATNAAQVAPRASQKPSQSTSAKRVFFVNAGITHESAMWKFEMTNISNSILTFNNLAWNVFDLNGGYVFNLGNTKLQVDAGFKYGMQWGDASMTDDDVSNDGYLIDQWENSSGNKITEIGHALSIGASKDGSMLGFNVGVGLTDFMKWGNIKITPSIGYRYLKYKLETSNNYGVIIDTLQSGCLVYSDGETQCDPVIIFYNATGTPAAVTRSDTNGNGVIDSGDRIEVPAGYGYVYAGDTYYYQQAEVSHSYDVEWSGPYIALDMLYDINQNNSVNGRVELGFPGYTATGDQPYRWDWAHPKGVEDSANMFSAFHLGLAANWQTAISNSVALSLGLTYDYYTVSGADSDTYLNESLYNSLVASNPTDATSLWMINQLEMKKAACGGWVCKSSKEIDSVYKSMGIRVGLNARF